MSKDGWGQGRLDPAISSAGQSIDLAGNPRDFSADQDDDFAARLLGPTT